MLPAMDDPTRETAAEPRLLAARAWHALFAVLVGAALVTQLVLSATGTGTEFVEDAMVEEVSAGVRIVRFFSFFTILSNIIFFAISLTLALRPDRNEGRWWRALRLDSVVLMTVTGLVYITVLHGLQELSGLREATNVVFHFIAPAAALVGWLLFGPRPQLTWQTVRLAMIVPLVWVAYTLVRGPIADWYPYPFIDVIEHGYSRVLLNVGVVGVLLFAVTSACLFADRRLPPAPRVRTPAQ
jgi:hypothetical protein